MKIYETRKDTNNFLKETDVDLSASSYVNIGIGNPKQTIDGFGGAFTEASCYMLANLSASDRRKVLENYFGSNGNNYNLARLTIHSCDFAMSNYEYVRDKDDVNLDSFDIKADFDYIIPIVKEALEINPNIKFLASPWSPPSFMKTTNMMNHGGKLKQEYYDRWALYFVKYIQKYQEIGIPIWAVTVQNEPSAVQTWESCIWTGQEEAIFVRDFLGPKFIENNIDTKIVVHDHNRDDVNDRVDQMFTDPKVRELVYGVGIHWYVVEEYENLTTLHDKYPEQHIIFTEGCCELGIGYKTGEWKNGEKYAYEIINNFNNYCESFLDWNLVLDHLGGPNHVKNFCEAPVMIDYENEYQVTYNNSYYYIQHFSKFIEPGDVVLDTTFETEQLFALVVKGKDCIKAIVLNRTESEIGYSINSLGFKTTLAKRSIQTVIL